MLTVNGIAPKESDVTINGKRKFYFYREPGEIWLNGKLSYLSLIGAPGTKGFGVGICPNQLIPANMYGLPGYDAYGHDNYGNYQYRDDSIMCWIPKFYYRIGHVSNSTYGTHGVNSIDVKGIDTYTSEAAANADGYALHRAFIDGGSTKDGFFFDKYMCSKNAWGTGQIASSIKDGLPLSTHADHNQIADLTACSSNHYYQTINAAHARDGVDGAVNASSVFYVASRLQYSALAILSMAHAQASLDTTNCAWYDATYNFPKGCNNDAFGDTDDGTVSYTSDGYSNCGKTGSGMPFAKTTHNGQVCGVADLNGLMWEVSLGVTAIVSIVNIEGMTKADPCVVTWTAHGLSTGDYVMIGSTDITQADWTALNNKIYTITKIDDNSFSLDGVDSSGFTDVYDAGTDPGKIDKATFYAAKEATAMKDFDSGNSGATDHWGATGVAAMMDSFVPAFETEYAINGFSQRFGSGANQVLDEATSGNGWLLTGLGFPKDKDGIDVTGTNQFGKDYFYQYLRGDLCLRSCGRWYYGSHPGVWGVYWSDNRTHSTTGVGFRAACYSG